MILALVAAAALQQAPLATPSIVPSVRLVEIERELALAPRGWPHGTTSAMVGVLAAGTLCGGLSAAILGLSAGGFGPANPLLIIPGGLLFVSAFASLVPAIILLIVSAVEAANRTAHVRALMAERERLVAIAPSP